MSSNLSRPRSRIPARRLIPAVLLVVGICLFALPAAVFADGGSNTGMSMPTGSYGTQSGGMSMPMGSTNGGAAASAGQDAAGGQGQPVVVHISNFSFGNPLTVAPGTTVQWINDDTAAHTVTADGGAFDSGSLAPGAMFSFTFSQAGDFPYYCRFHGGPGGQGMSSRVTVSDQAGAPSGGQNGAAQGNGNSMNMQGGNNYQAPGNNYQAPSNNYQPPSNGNTYKAPSYGNTYKAPSKGNTYRAPSYGNTYKAPSYGNTYRVPSYNNNYSYSAPSYGNRYAAPSCRSSSSGYSASRYGGASSYSRYLQMPYGSRMGMQRYSY